MSDPQPPKKGERRIPLRAPRREAAPLTVSPAVLALSDELRMCDTHAARELALEYFWATHSQTPILETNNPGRAFAEGHYTVTFLWQDAEAEEVQLYANHITDERDLTASLMRRVPGTDIWHLSYRMRGDWRASYSFIRRLPGESWPWVAGDQFGIRHALDRGLADPRNPRSCRNRQGTKMSVASLPDASPQPWLERRDDLSARGQVTEQIGPDGRRVWVYVPPKGIQDSALSVSDSSGRPEPSGPTNSSGPSELFTAPRHSRFSAFGTAAEPADSSPALPIVVLLDGEVWTGTQDIATTVDNLLADAEMRPCLIVMPESRQAAARAESVDPEQQTGDARTQLRKTAHHAENADSNGEGYAHGDEEVPGQDGAHGDEEPQGAQEAPSHDSAQLGEDAHSEGEHSEDSRVGDPDGIESAWIADQLLPWVRKNYSVSEHVSDVVIAGQSVGAYIALRTALEYPEKFGGVLSQSASMWQRRLPSPNPALIHHLHVYLEVGSQEWVLCNPNERLASEFARFGSDTHFVEYNGGHDYACWRGGIADGLRALLGPAADH